MTALVTGGAGFVGRHLVAQLAAAGGPVRVLDVAPRPPEFGDDVDYRQGSILDAEALAGAMAGVDTVYHLAANPHLWARDKSVFHRINVDGTAAVLSAVRQAGVRRIVVTATEVILRDWRSNSPEPLTEAEPTPPASAMAGPYTRSKHAADRLVREAAQAGLPVVSLYPTVPIGPGDVNMTAPTAMLRGFLEGKTPAFLDCRLNLIAVGDVAAAHILAAEKAAPGARYIIAGEDVLLSDLLDWLEEISGRPVPQRRVPYWLAAASGHVGTFVADHLTGRAPMGPIEGVRLARGRWPIDGGKALRELGLTLTPARVAVERAVRWLLDDAENAMPIV